MRPVARIGDNTNENRPIKSGSFNVYANNIPVARIGDTVGCEDGGDGFVASGSSNVYVNGIPVSGTGDTTTCPSTIINGSNDVFVK
jgi:uncharacterized Zn-binding protein involved in type VI secretion